VVKDLFIHTLQSICTHYSCFENMGWFVTLKRKVQNMGCKKQGAKTGSKSKEAAWPLLFLNNNDPVFCTLPT
jgi:hypothetical protein